MTTKLPEATITAIRSAYLEGVKPAVIARDVGCCHSSVNNYTSDLGPVDVVPPLPAADDPGPDYPWRDRAACRKTPGDAFFPVPGDKAAIARAKSLCYRCPVISACLAEAMTLPDVGIRGATTARERRALGADIPTTDGTSV